MNKPPHHKIAVYDGAPHDAMDTIAREKLRLEALFPY